MKKTTLDKRVEILALTYHFYFDEPEAGLVEFCEDYKQTLILAQNIQSEWAKPTKQGISAINDAFDELCFAFNITEDRDYSGFNDFIKS